MMLYNHSTPRRWLLATNLILLFAAATLCRALMLDHVPGLNGDEAWQGVQAQRWLHGEPVAWRTPTGNPINPLTFLPMAALHAWLPPSITLLRLTPLVSGLAALAVNFWLCRRVFDRQLAIVSTVILAVLPAMMAYSRFAWDASQSVLVTLPVIYGALGAVRDPLRRRSWLVVSVAAFCLALLVHPTNVFAAPLIAVAAAWCWRKDLAAVWNGCHWRPASAERGLRWQDARGARARVAVAIRWLGIMVAIGLLLGCGVAASHNSKVAAAAERLVSPSQAASFAGYVVDLLSGTTIYRYIPAVQLQAAEPATLVYRLAVWLTIAAAGYGLWQRDATVRVLLAGWCCGLAAFYLVAGPQAIRPGFERYGMWMIGPAALLLALGVRWWMPQPHCSGPLRPAAALLLAWAMLAGFGWHYFRPIALGLGDSHVAFRTATVEPKLAALRLIGSQQSTPPATIVAHGWWVYWPLAYLSGADRRLTIVPENVPGERQPPEGTSRAAWQVSFVDEPQSGDREPAARKSRSSIISDAGQRPLLRVVRPEATETMTPPVSLPRKDFPKNSSRSS